MKIAIHASGVGSRPAKGQVFGVQIAVADWVRAFFRYGDQADFSFLIADEAARDKVCVWAAESDIDPARLRFLDARFGAANLAAFDVVFRVDSDPHDFFWQRARLAPAPGPVFCGLVHAIGGREGGNLLRRYMLEPARPGDALVCPSRAVAGVVRSFWDSYGTYLETRFGRKPVCPVALPRVPLGVDTGRIKTTSRASARAALEIPDDAIVVLWVGRLSHAIKAHPYAMFSAVEAAARRTGRAVVFAIQGYFVPAEAEAEFRALAASFCSAARVVFVAQDDPRFPDGLWGAGDIFLSLVDNAQESFGLTPIEAIAAGLPRVLSDWDGYRDSVTQGQDGFVITTRQPPAGAGDALSALVLDDHEMYGGFLAKTAQCVAVDIPMATEALIALIENPALRRDMAEKARARLPDYDWKNIIPQYLALFDDLLTRRPAEAAPEPFAPPEVPDPFQMFASYATAPFDPASRVQVLADAAQIKKLWQHPMNVLSLDLMLSGPEISALLNRIAQTKLIALSDLAKAHADLPRFWRTIGWLAKLGIIGII